MHVELDANQERRQRVKRKSGVDVGRACDRRASGVDRGSPYARTQEWRKDKREVLCVCHHGFHSRPPKAILIHGPIACSMRIYKPAA